MSVVDSLADPIRAQIRNFLSRRLIVGSIFAIVFVIALFALSFLLMAGQERLARWYQSSIEADLTIGGVLALIAIIGAIYGNVVRTAPVQNESAPVGLALAIPVAARLAPRLMNKKVLGIASMVIGAILISREFAQRR